MKSNDPIWRRIHYPALAVCLGTVFMAPPQHREQGNLICVKWTILSLALICFCALYDIARHHESPANEGKIVKSVFLVGMIEVIVCLLQSTKVMVSYNPFFAFTGSFSNPAMLAILLSVCIPIGVFYARQSVAREKWLWSMATFSMGVCLLFSTSRTCILAVCASCIILFLRPTAVLSCLRHRMKSLFFFVVIVLPLLFLFMLKQDSTNGRVLIWTNAARMIADKPLLGWGANGFSAHYMLYQAAFFTKFPHSEYADLADNIAHPLSEYLLIAVDYGIAGLAVLLLVVFLLMRVMRRSKSKYRKLYLSVSMSIVVCSLFSYPFKMPFIWIVSAYLACTSLRTLCLGQVRYLGAPFLVVAVISLFFRFVCGIDNQWRWASLQDNPHQKMPDEILKEYEFLYAELYHNSYFLYNYGAVLHQSGNFKESTQVLEECENLYNDYNVQMLLGDNFRQQGMAEDAVNKFSLAGRMIPCRFLPLYYEMETYMENGELDKAYRIANAILQKHVKVKNTPAVDKIRSQARLVIEKNKNE